MLFRSVSQSRYGGSGGGGTTSGAGQASGVGQPSKTGTEVGLQAQGMALQLANVMSQTRLNESQAEKNKAEAEKISGVIEVLLFVGIDPFYLASTPPEHINAEIVQF